MTEKLRPFLLAAACLGLAGLVWLDNRPDPQPAAPSMATTAPAESKIDTQPDTETTTDTAADTKTDTEAEPSTGTVATATAEGDSDASEESGIDAGAPVVETGTTTPAEESDSVESSPASATAQAPSEGGAAEVPVEGGATAEADDGDNVANPLSSFTLDMLDQTVGRPLFAPARKRPPPAEAGAPDAPAKTDHAYDLLGVALGGNRPIAIMRKKQDGKSFRVEVGDMLGGWHVSKVDSQSVELERAGGEQEIVPLFRE